jgi:hypothetical protein
MILVAPPGCSDDDPLPAKTHPLHKPVPGLSDIRRGADGPPQVLLIHEAKQKDRSDDAAQGVACQVQLVLTDFCAEFAQDRGRTDFALADGQGHPQHIREVDVDQTPLGGVAKELANVRDRSSSTKSVKSLHFYEADRIPWGEHPTAPPR